MLEGASVYEYRAPLFIAWQLTNRCSANCLTCCEESGPDKAWSDELDAAEALVLAERIVAANIPYVAFGGGEPLGVEHFWSLLELLAEGGVSLKIETDGRYIDETNADRLISLAVSCVQISVDGATSTTHERMRPGSSFASAIDAIGRLTERGLAPEFVFVPTRLNIHELPAAYDLAASLGCSAFVTGPLMRIGRAARDWNRLGCSAAAWKEAVTALEHRAASTHPRTKLAVYPWDILTEMERRLESPQAMLLVVPNGRVKLLNALPFAPADLRADSLELAWQAYRDAWRSPAVRTFVSGCRGNPRLLRHANETWSMEESGKRVSELCGG